QGRLLRVLQEREVMRLGGTKVIPVDVRIIAATNQDLTELMRRGAFRQDLFFRLAVLVLSVPPLRERTEDIPYLVRAFIREWTENGGKHVLPPPEEDMERLKAYPWPGNVRELRNLVERAIVLCNAGKPIRLFQPGVWLPVHGTVPPGREGDSPGGADPPAGRHATGTSPNTAGPDKLGRYTRGRGPEEEWALICRVLEEEGGRIGRAAQRLGMHRTTLWRKLRRRSTQ
ncbi:MAG: sigma-54-dependent Fis family transcriptional regulator, partial [Alicyclobacillaceae bacterium]|nr:sigma-54-dependent Fis family transcriptional regulator [Alicyclobacillaceae bacterium]